MISRRKLLVVVCVLPATIVTLVVFLLPKTPSYNGKSISQWLAWFDSPQGLSQQQWQERLQERVDATHALRQMGPDVFPYLRQMLQADSGTTKFFYQLGRDARNQPSVGSVVTPSPEEARMLRAVEACSALGRDAQVMIPDLLQLLEGNAYRNVRSRAAYALGEIGGTPEKVVPALVQSLSNHVDGNILISLGKYGADANAAVPTIVALLDAIQTNINAHKPFDKNVLCEAAQALHQIAPPEAEKKLPMLRQALQEERAMLFGSPG
jgi:HEAT repeat protein